MRNAILLLLFAATAGAQSIGTFVPTGNMATARSQHTATLLNDGRILITGGPDDTTELYDPSTGKFSATGNMTEARQGHTATLLADGRVLIAAGWGLTSAEIYERATGLFTPTGSLLEDQGGHTATLLPDGKVLIAGGERSAPPWPTAARAELYDPLSGLFSFATNYAENGTLYVAGGPIWPTANRLFDGRVLLVGENPPEIYDPVTGSFSVTGPLLSVAYKYGMDWHAATTLRDGTVLVTGGSDDFSCDGFNNAELYDPSSGTFAILSPMTQIREIHTSTLLLDGTVLITGGGDGWCYSSTYDTAELFIPSTHSFVAAGRMTRSRSDHTATLLLDGSVLIAGGFSYWPYSTTNTAEIYRPPILRGGRLRSTR